MHPDDLLEQLKANANARKQKNLDLIHAVCRERACSLGEQGLDVVGGLVYDGGNGCGWHGRARRSARTVSAAIVALRRQQGGDAEDNARPDDADTDP